MMAKNFLAVTRIEVPTSDDSEAAPDPGLPLLHCTPLPLPVSLAALAASATVGDF